LIALLYIETNFLLSFATGRDLGVNSLLAGPPAHVRLVLPSACYMEAFTVLESLKRDHGRFSGDFRNKINEVGRSVVWPDRESRLKLLQQSLLEIDSTFDRLQRRLYLAVDTLAHLAEGIETSESILGAAARRRIIQDATDNLVLAGILEHAKERPSQTKIFLSENRRDFFDNPEAKQALADLDIKYFRDAQKCKDWLSWLLTQPDDQQDGSS
jgi:hypothetical protein